MNSMKKKLSTSKAGLIYLALRGSRSFYTVLRGFSEVPPKATSQGIPIRASAPYTHIRLFADYGVVTKYE